MNSKRRRALAVRARATVGPVFRQDLLCLACGAEMGATYRQAPERIPCPACGARACMRDEDEPYPPPPEPLPM